MEYDEETHRWHLRDQDALIGWRIARAEPWRPGLVRLHLVRPGGAEPRLVYAEGKTCPCCGTYLAK
jgi:hypothetical protein